MAAAPLLQCEATPGREDFGLSRRTGALSRLPAEEPCLRLTSRRRSRSPCCSAQTTKRSRLRRCQEHGPAVHRRGLASRCACSIPAHNAMVMLPINVAPWMWGWPDRFLNRMKAANSEVFVLGPYRGGEFSTGIDTPDQFARLPANYSGGIWTNEIEAIAPLAGKRKYGANSAIPALPARCARHTRCSRRQIGGCLPASARASDWRARPENAGRAKRTAWCPRIRRAR